MLYYTLACGHYALDDHGEDGAPPPAACPFAVERRERWEWSPCASLICELEVQRTGTWGWSATVNGVKIDVFVTSSGHCEVWLDRGYKKPDYKALTMAEKAVKETKTSESESETSGGSIAAGSESNTSVTGIVIESLSSNSMTIADDIHPRPAEGARKKLTSWLSRPSR
jgi:hypothetical protein